VAGRAGHDAAASAHAFINNVRLSACRERIQRGGDVSQARHAAI